MTPSDLRTDDGEIDARLITGGSGSRQRRVRPEECRVWRLLLIDGWTTDAIAREWDTHRHDETVREHAIGDCECDHDVPPVEHVQDVLGRSWLPVYEGDE